MKLKHTPGFTLVELMLAMAFVSVLLLAIALTSIQAGRLYNRGAVLRSVNQAGRTISDTLRRDFLQSNSQKLNIDAKPSDVVGGVVLTRNAAGKTVSGRLCLGYYSYVWNAAEALTTNDKQPGLVVYDSGEPVNFVRVIDVGGNMCVRSGVSEKYPTVVEKTNTTELLKAKNTTAETTLLIYNLSVDKITTTNEPEELYRVKFTIGTNRLGEIDTVNQQCRPPGDGESNLEFCAINNFDMIVRTNG